MSSAYLLVSHGSRDPRPQTAAKYLTQLVLQALDAPEVRFAIESRNRSLKNSLPIVGSTTLEFASLPLHQSIEKFALRAKAAGFNEVQIVPLFLHAGVHVLEDLPAAVEQAQHALTAGISLNLLPHLGSYAGVERLLVAEFERLDARQRILLAHGSRRPRGNDGISSLANRLGARVAYWSIAPSLAQQVSDLAAGEAIAIVPYFLFAGNITEAIAAENEQLQRQVPETALRLGQPLGATPELAASIVEALVEANRN
ncbi:sirohydrochlorin chelatase [Oscillatoria sp. FACHB-1406]|uniref:sirohydrochlorin chelatase n=1 Tax=Oscillatoria sp. FACHB-1406 TaxID=2692846 RepID=UPI001682374E|nr:sirohydrochlorin chelatase [Oscillatoria sp. FACHB-1406]MBD2579151.1 sirohydrochlorin chelatase [Oscillatoria sp. FACHB-1406]